MNPLLLADWDHVNRVFCFAMWTVAAVLVAVILGHVIPNEPAAAGHVVMHGVH
jgi:hypothetical protein